MTNRPLGNKVVDASLAILITGVPILHGGIFNFRIIHHDQFNHGSVQLVFITLGSGTAFEITDMATLIGNNQGALKLTGILFINPKVCRQLHRAASAFRDIDKGAISKHRRI